MKLSLSLLAASLATADASAWNNLRRRLSYEKVATYAPGSQVTGEFIFIHVAAADKTTTIDANIT